MRKSGLMKKVVVLGLTVAMALGTMVTGNAAEGKVWKYSFNNKTWNADLAGDWVNAYGQVYSSAVGYGFDAANGYSFGVITKQASTKTELGDIGLDCADEVLLNAIAAGAAEQKTDEEVNFYVDLPAGTYNITVYAGGQSQNEVYDGNRIFVNGEEIVRNYETDPWNSDTKSSNSKLLTADNLKWTKTITLAAATKVEIKASNPSRAMTYFGAEKTGGGRAYLNAVVIEEATAGSTTETTTQAPTTQAPTTTPATTGKTDTVVPKTGVISAVAVCGVVALAGASVAVVTKKKED